MDEALYYLTEAEECMKSIIPISLADSFFEETDEAKDANEKNEKAKTGAIAAIKKAIHSLIQSIKDMITKFADFFRTMALTPEEREQYKAFKKMVKEDPDFAKKTITIADWRAYNKAYEEALKELEEAAKKPSFGNEAVDAIIENLQSKISELADTSKGAAGRAALSVTLSTAVDIADQNVTMAKAINFALKNELISLEDIEKSLGAEEAAKFSNKIEKAAKNSIFHRARVKIFKHRDKTFKAIIKRQFNDLLSFTNIKDGKVKDGKSIVDKGSIARGVIKNRKMVVDAVGGKENATEISKNLAATAAKAGMAKFKMDSTIKKAKKSAKKSAKEMEELKKFFS